MLLVIWAHRHVQADRVRTVLTDRAHDIAAAIERAKQKADWGWLAIEVVG